MKAIAEAHDTAHVPMTFDSYQHVTGPFFHGTKREFAIGEMLAELAERRELEWPPAQILQGMLDSIAKLGAHGLGVIED